MTVHWNSRRGFRGGLNTASSAAERIEAEEEKQHMPALLWAMRKTPEIRPAAVHRGRRLLADPDYPSKAVLRKVADVLAANLTKAERE
jgi:hypothetical protein